MDSSNVYKTHLFDLENDSFTAVYEMFQKLGFCKQDIALNVANHFNFELSTADKHGLKIFLTPDPFSSVEDSSQNENVSQSENPCSENDPEFDEFASVYVKLFTFLYEHKDEAFKKLRTNGVSAPLAKKIVDALNLGEEPPKLINAEVMQEIETTLFPTVTAFLKIRDNFINYNKWRSVRRDDKMCTIITICNYLAKVLLLPTDYNTKTLDSYIDGLLSESGKTGLYSLAGLEKIEN